MDRAAGMSHFVQVGAGMVQWVELAERDVARKHAAMSVMTVMIVMHHHNLLQRIDYSARKHVAFYSSVFSWVQKGQ